MSVDVRIEKKSDLLFKMIYYLFLPEYCLIPQTIIRMTLRASQVKTLLSSCSSYAICSFASETKLIAVLKFTHAFFNCYNLFIQQSNRNNR